MYNNKKNILVCSFNGKKHFLFTKLACNPSTTPQKVALIVANRVFVPENSSKIVSYPNKGI